MSFSANPAGLAAVLIFACGALIKPCAAAELTGKVMCGYQGWFRCESDGARLGWRHYGGRDFGPGKCGIDLWPDVSELAPEERFATAFQNADGSAAEVFSSAIPATVHRHFQWMRDYGIDGAFVQRFIADAGDERLRASMDSVLQSCQSGAQKAGVLWALMYDLTGSGARGPARVIEDWKRVREERRVADDEHYVRHERRQLVALWGLGFNDREAHFEEWTRLIEFLKADGCAVMLGVPAYWRTLDRDARTDPALHGVIARAGIVSPWTVGRYGSGGQAGKHGENVWQPDREWCDERKLKFLPVIFPGFSWHNLQKARGKDAPLDAIPRRGGEFLWRQALAAKRAGAEMLYVAMFDEMDEATAIFKTTQTPPAGASPFVAEPGVPGDRCLWLTGAIGRMLRGEIPPGEIPPAR